MLTTRRRTAVAGLLAALAVSVTGCSSDSGNSSANDKIKGADSSESASVSPSASASADKNAPGFDFPSDITVTVDRKATGDGVKDAVLRDLAYSAQARLEAFAKGNGQTANLNRYFAGYARTYWINRVAELKKEGLTVTGHYRYFDFEVTDIANGKTAAARYCEDQSKAYGKVIKTQKVQVTKPSDKDFILNTFQVAKDSAGDWQVTQESWKKGDASCVQG
ncbi:hypothetical protein ACIPSJ_09440 [Streptomyces sp. NPDC090088]|uniref:hypothetical protein n=1 Tax=Streptomyces sp. NPDC090088 TaxID=3365944 RepID=UPI0038117E80